MPARLYIDFETRSACSLRASGSWRYSLDPSTEVLCMAFRLSTWAKGRTALWHPAFPHLGIPERFDMDDMDVLLQHIESGGDVEAHNAWFERGIWVNKMVPRCDFPPIDWTQWRCSAAKAAAHALPRALEDAVTALRVATQKDMVGAKLMKKLAKPRKARKKEREIAEELKIPLPVLYFESREMFDQLCAYCRQDVLAEADLSESLPDLSADELQVYLIDQAVNEYGFGLDADAIDAALALIEQETVRLNHELLAVTNGCVEKATQRATIKAWLETEGLYLDDTRKDTIDGVLETAPNLTPPARRALEILRILGQSSTAKYKAMKAWICPDGRAHGSLLYHGASTGRWTGAGVQPQNFPRGSVADIEAAWAALKTRDSRQIVAINVGTKDAPKPVGDVMRAVSESLRGAIIPAPGHQLYVADYAAIEARVLLWLADEQDGLDLFRQGADIYCVMAGEIYGYPCNKKDHPQERALGKVAILGLGYQMGWRKFIDTCMAMAKIEISADLSQRTVEAYRTKFWRVKEMWWAMESAAIQCLLTRTPVECGKVCWFYRKPFLYCELPSGRRLAYPDPEVHPRPVPWGGTKDSLTYMGIDQYTRKWKRQHSYGGLLTENVDQAVARDLIAHAFVQCWESDTYRPVLTVHDEIIAEARVGTGDVHQFEQLVSSVPDWARGCPVAAEGWAGPRYRK